MRVALGCLLALLTATSATAQSPYAGGSVVFDIVRLSGSRDFDTSGDGESVGGAVRVGTSIGERWGVDLEFARTGDIESQPDVRILGDTFPTITPIPAIFPQPEINTRRQSSMLTTTLWGRHEAGDRLDLVYLGGVAFTRTETHLRIEIPGFPIPLPIGGVIRPAQVIEQEAVSYGTGVAVGLDGRIRMTERLRLVPGVRLLGVPGGWVVRPAIGVHWMF
jgi:hypothetical protein